MHSGTSGKRYFFGSYPDLLFKDTERGLFSVEASPHGEHTRALKIATQTIRLAKKMGVGLFSPSQTAGLPYHAEDDSLVFSAELCSWVAQEKIFFLRGWKLFGSCVKGFNALGLMAEHVTLQQEEEARMPREERLSLRRSFAASRRDANGNPVFSDGEVKALSDEQLLSIPDFSLSIWAAFHERPVICSTSSNMGISMHEALRLLQKSSCELAGKKFTILNSNEGKLVVWCPDPRADFMNEEKSKLLEAIASESPPLTSLQTYINRQQRDPGALKEALEKGGVFFPTNPQSQEELQNLLFVAMEDLAKERGIAMRDLLNDANVRKTLKSLKAVYGENEQIHVRYGVDGGVHGLMVAYLLLVEEILAKGLPTVSSTWNQASIGAALAAAVLADEILKTSDLVESAVWEDLTPLLPRTCALIKEGKFQEVFRTRIHGVFDTSNLQSLAQLLGVVVDKHLTGRGTAFVGLGSSSYANGNRCYDILKRSMEQSGAFRGQPTFHPATHSINPFAQALIFAEDLLRAVKALQPRFPSSVELTEACRRHIKKPEPAGAAALAGYLLKRLDMGTLSLFSIALGLKKAGFNKSRFLQFAGFSPDAQGESHCNQLAAEEGSRMGQLTHSVLTLLDWPMDQLTAAAAKERSISKEEFTSAPVEDSEFQSESPATFLYLTGDNTGQPSAALIEQLILNCSLDKEEASPARSQLRAIH